MNNQKFCPKCGNPLSPAEKFCGKCGNPVPTENLQPAGQAPQVTPPTQPQQNAMPYSQGNAIPNVNNGMPQGNTIPNGAGFTQQPDNAYQNPAYAGAVAAPKKPNPFTKVIDLCKQNKKIPIIAGAALVVIIAGIIILANILKYQKIDAKELFDIKFEGINSCGTVSGELNAYDSYVYETSKASSKVSDALSDYGVDLGDLEDYASSSSSDEKVSPYFSIKESELLDAYTKASDEDEAVDMRSALLKTTSKGGYKLKLKFDKEDNLKNGDKVKCTVTYDEDYLKENNIKLKNTEFEIEVKDLEDGTEINPFDLIDVTFSGSDGSGEASVSNKSDTIASAFYYDYDYTRSLSNNDTFTVTANCGYSAEKAGDKYWFKYDDKYYIIENSEMTKDYTVSGLTKLNEIDPFENIEFNYYYAVPYLTISYVNTDNMNEALKNNVSYNIEASENLKIGDTFTVSAYAYSSLSSDGYKLKGTPDAEGYITKEFTIDETFPAYVTTKDADAASKSLDDVYSDAITGARQSLQGSSYVSNIDVDGKIKSITSFDLAETYVMSNKAISADNIGWGDSMNALVRVYKVVVATENGDKSSQTFYCALSISNVVDKNGEFTTENSPETAYFSTLKEARAAITDREGYTAEAVTADSAKAETPATDSKAETTTAATTTKGDATTKSDDSSTAETTTTTKKTADTTTTTATTLVP